jgi:hypothetical protein
VKAPFLLGRRVSIIFMELSENEQKIRFPLALEAIVIGHALL